MDKLSAKPFPGAQDELKRVGYKDPMLQSIYGMRVDAATDASEAAFAKDKITAKSVKTVEDSSTLPSGTADQDANNYVIQMPIKQLPAGPPHTPIAS